jgi:hypothetical protein
MCGFYFGVVITSMRLAWRNLGARWCPIIGEVSTPQICLGLSLIAGFYCIRWEFFWFYQWATVRSAAIQNDFRNAHFEII